MWRPGEYCELVRQARFRLDHLLRLLTRSRGEEWRGFESLSAHEPGLTAPQSPGRARRSRMDALRTLAQHRAHQ